MLHQPPSEAWRRPTLSPRSEFAQSPWAHISQWQRSLNLPWKVVDGKVTFQLPQGPFASSWALCARECLFEGDTREKVWATQSGRRCSRVARVGKIQFFREVDRVSHGCWPQLTLTRSSTERCKTPASFRIQSHLQRGVASGSAEANSPSS